MRVLCRDARILHCYSTRDRWANVVRREIQHFTRETIEAVMHELIYLVGLVVVVMVILGALGLR